MKNNYLNKISRKDLHDFISLCKSLNFEFDENEFENIVVNTLKYLNGDKEKRNELRHMQILENKWYDSLKEGKPDFSVYDDVYYLADTWVCWKKYSREYIKSIVSDKSMASKSTTGFYNLKSIKDYMHDVNIIADLGCGIGYTSAALKQIFDCNVYATNIKDTKQYKICENLDAGFNLIENISDIKTAVDMVFASEYFEHFEYPIKHLLEILETLKPRYFLFANTFNAKSIGHFDVYENKYTGAETSRIFSNTLKNIGYKKVNTNCYNNRPNFYERIK